MVSNDPIPRAPKGTPRGGEFAERLLPPSDTILADDSSYNAQGSAIHPPIPRDARQVVNFWTTVEMPDHLINNVIIADMPNGFGGARIGDYKKSLKWHQDIVKDLHRPAWRRKNFVEESRVPDLKRMWGQRLEALQKGKRKIPREEVQQVTRMAQAYLQSWRLPNEEGKRVRDAKFSYGTTTKTPREIWDYYCLWEIEPAFFEATKYRYIEPQ